MSNQRMQANVDAGPGIGHHQREHDYIPSCDDAPECVPLIETSNSPYVITVREFDPEKHQSPIYNTLCKEGWSWASLNLDDFDGIRDDMPIVVRDKPKPKTLEEVIKEHYLKFYPSPPECQCGYDVAFGDSWNIHIAEVLRKAFPELKDK